MTNAAIAKLVTLRERVYRGDIPPIEIVSSLDALAEDLKRLDTAAAVTGKLFPVVVDYRKSLAQMIADAHLDRVDQNIHAANFRLPKKRTREDVILELVHLDRLITTSGAEHEVKKNRKLRLATLPEQLAFAAHYPDKQREFPIVALGSSCVLHGSRHVPYLWGSDSRRELGLPWYGGSWLADYRFLAARK